MTKKEYREAHRLTDREKAQTWHEISAPFNQHRARPRRWVPALGGFAAAVSAVVVAIMLTGDDGRGPSPHLMDVAVRPSEEAVAESPAPPMMERQARSMAAVPTGMNKVASDDLALAESATVSRGTITGTVTDQESGEVLPYANIILKGTHVGVAADTLGQFTFIDVPEGSHDVQILYLGYQPEVVTVNVAGNDTIQMTLALKPQITETLTAFNVDAARYMVEVKNASSIRDSGSGKYDRYAIDSVEDAKSREAGVITRDGQLYVRGGRSGEVQAQIDGVTSVPQSAPGTMGAESGGTRNPNDRPYDLVYHQHYGVNPFVPTEEDALSTFAIEVDDASWTVARRYLDDGNMPPPEAVRLEEIVNRLDAGFERDGDQDFTLHADGMPSRFGDGYQLLRIGVQARDIPAVDRRPAHLVFVIDISGSMNRENRLGLVKKALRVLVSELQDRDRVGIVVYGSQARVHLEPTGLEERDTILAAIESLSSGGSTNAEAGLRMAYQMAQEHAVEGTISRLILCSDGVANMGNTGSDSILDSVRHEADQGTSLTTVGFGMGNYNDVLMEQLANKGDGTYHYVQKLLDAERVFRQNLTGTLQNVGREVKTQVEFDPGRVVRWRLLGYENRDVADEDFRNDAIDAGEIGAGHTAVALYEVKLTARAQREIEQGKNRRLGTIRLRWEKPVFHDQAGEVTEIERPIKARDLASTWDDAAPRLRAAAVAAEFAEILRLSFWARGSLLVDLKEPVIRLVSELPEDQDIIDLSQMIHRAADLEIQED